MEHFSEIATFNFNLMLYKTGCHHPSNKFEIFWRVAQNSVLLLLSYFVAQYVVVIIIIIINIKMINTIIRGE